jgi:hypothetical protein
VARRATPSKRRFFVGVGAAHPHEKPLVELTQLKSEKVFDFEVMENITLNLGSVIGTLPKGFDLNDL